MSSPDDELDPRTRCDILDVLEEASVLKRAVHARTRFGEDFVDDVLDVPTEGGVDFVVFARRGRMRVDDLRGVSRAEEAPTR